MNIPRLIVIIGARPQFIKHFAFERAAQGRLELVTIHTGQHYDSNMSDIFFDQLEMKKPDYSLTLGGGDHGEQTGKMIIEIEKILKKENPKGVVVYGDTNSTLAGAIAASKLHIPIYHIEAGLRSYNRYMPEEINRVLTDHISKLLFVPSITSVDNLKSEGIIQGMHIVGDIMKDVVYYVVEHELIGMRKISNEYYYATIHRPYNTDDKSRLTLILNQFNQLDKPVIMSLHPRTNSFVKKYNIDLNSYQNIVFILPQSYFANLNYLFYSSALLTDSGGMQKEAYWLKRKCITIRTETEWTETLEKNANVLLFEDLASLGSEIKASPQSWNDNLFGNGRTAQGIVDIILKEG